MRPEKKERIFDNKPYCKSCRRSENFCQCDGHNSCHDLHTEWLKSDECKKEIARVLHYRFGKHYESSEIKIATSAISRYLGGEK